jgi:hypothetical protein
MHKNNENILIIQNLLIEVKFYYYSNLYSTPSQDLSLSTNYANSFPEDIAFQYRIIESLFLWL